MIDVRHTRDGRVVLESAVKHHLNAQVHLSRRYAHDERYALLHHRDQFYEWAGSHWSALPLAELKKRLKAEFSLAVVEKVVTSKETGEEEIALVDYSPSKQKYAELIEALALEVGLDPRVDTPVWLTSDGDPDLSVDIDPRDVMACANVLLDTRSRSTAPHTPRFVNHFAAGYPYDAEAPEPDTWLRFLADLWPEDRQSVDTLQEVFGYLLTTRTDLQKMLMLIGPPRSGKGTIIRVLTAMLGGGVGSVSLADLNQRFGLAEVATKQVAVMQDARFRSRDDGMAVERLLSIIGEDPVSVEQKGRDIYTGKLPTRFILVSNEIPKMQDESGALQARVLMLRMLHTVPEEKRDSALFDRLMAELSGILNWSLAGLDRLNARGHFVQPASGAEDVEFMAKLSSPTSGFVEEACVLGSDLSVPKRDLFRVYTQWCADTNTMRMSENLFARNLYASAPGVRAARLREIDPDTGGRKHVYRGAALSTEGEYLLRSCPPDWRPKAEASDDDPTLPTV